LDVLEVSVLDGPSGLNQLTTVGSRKNKLDFDSWKLVYVEHGLSEPHLAEGNFARPSSLVLLPPDIERGKELVPVPEQLPLLVMISRGHGFAVRRKDKLPIY
jgi:hypothetical protein